MKNNICCSRLQFFVVVFLSSIATSANAALVSRLNGQAVYDTDRNTTWLATANLALTNTFGVSGINSSGYMSWDTAQSWIAAMNAVNYPGYSDWRLPTTLKPDSSCSSQSQTLGSYGWDFTGSEMGHLFYSELEDVAGYSIATYHNSNYSLFSNLPTTLQ